MNIEAVRREFLMETADCNDEGRGRILILQGSGHADGSTFNILSSRGFMVESVGSFDAALARLETIPFELILLDTVISDSNGIALCRHLKANPRTWDIPVIFLTSAADAGLASAALDTGAVDFVSKPFNADELTARIENHLELKRTRDELQRTIREKNELMSTIAHELKNPLTVIQTAGALLRKSGLSGSDPRAELVDCIIDSGAQSLRIINDRMKRLSRENRVLPTRIEPVDLVDAVQQVIEQNRGNALAKEIEIRADLPEGKTPEVLGDYQSVCVVIDNLVSNAIKFSSPKAAVRIVVAEDSRTGMYRISVRDQGPGLTPEDRRQLFRPYQRLSASPTGGESSHGLGLSIAARLVGSMRGEIGCDSEHGKGATFWFNLRANQAEVPAGDSRLVPEVV